MSSGTTRVCRKRRCSVSPDPPRPRINPWVTPFTPPSDEGLRRARACSLPVGVEASKREEAAKREKLGSSPETVWSAAFKTTFAYLKEDTSVDATRVLISPICWRAADAWADAERYQWERNHLLQGLHKTASGVRTRACARERIDRLGERILEALGLYQLGAQRRRVANGAVAAATNGRRHPIVGSGLKGRGFIVIIFIFQVNSSGGRFKPGGVISKVTGGEGSDRRGYGCFGKHEAMGTEMKPEGSTRGLIIAIHTRQRTRHHAIKIAKMCNCRDSDRGCRERKKKKESMWRARDGRYSHQRDIGSGRTHRMWAANGSPLDFNRGKQLRIITGIFLLTAMSSTKQFDADHLDNAEKWMGPWFLIHWGLITRNEVRAFDVQEADSPFIGDENDPCDKPTYAAHTFNAILKFLPRCQGFQHVFTRTEAGNSSRFVPFFMLSKGRRECWITNAESIYYAKGAKYAGIYITDLPEDAADYREE
ncbi:hypothetical protein FB451DRAFT_1372765 [Mycena latifolia]|nr:hypothetical protein FB451DRAFT_1372765 [Mycena latifolia]